MRSEEGDRPSAVRSARYAATEIRPDNPCDRIGPALGAQKYVVQHMQALPHRDVASAIEKVRMSSSGPVVKLAFEFLVLTATRSGEGRVDRDRPGRGSVDHPGRAHEDEPRAPDPAQPPCAGDSRRGADARSRGRPARVSERAGNPLGVTALSRLLKRLGIAAVPHGFRSSFRDWAAEETDHPREVAEAALAHVVRNQVEAAYRRTDLFERRRRLMDDWAAYLADGSPIRYPEGKKDR